MDVFEAIFSRQSVSRLRPDALPREVIEQVLEAAVQAPNHYRVRPWRFFVLTGPARERLGAVMAQALVARQPFSPPEAVEKERARPLRAPVVIAVAVDPPAEERVVEVENICAAAAAVQNLLLAAHTLGLGAIWRTGKPAYSAEVKAFFGLAPAQHLIGFVYLGLPEALPALAARPTHADRTIWLA
jgi:nitroreductase